MSSKASARGSASLPDWVADVLADRPAMLTIGEVAEVMRCCPRTVTRTIASGRLRAVRTDGGSSRVLVPRRALADYLGGLSS